MTKHVCDGCHQAIAAKTYFDRHGDPELLCEPCYRRAIDGDTSEDLKRRDKLVAQILAGAGVLVLAYMLLGCATPQIKSRVASGIPVIEHIDTGDAPPPCGVSHLHGCFDVVDGVAHVWYSSVSPKYVLDHEIEGHVKGMRHGPYAYRGAMRSHWCAEITRGTERYPMGSLVCNDGNREYLLSSAYFADIAMVTP